MSAIIRWFKSIHANDPVHACHFYKKNGCSHVDGMLCDMDTCTMRKL